MTTKPANGGITNTNACDVEDWIKEFFAGDAEIEWPLVSKVARKSAPALMGHLEAVLLDRNEAIAALSLTVATGDKAATMVIPWDEVAEVATYGSAKDEPEPASHPEPEPWCEPYGWGPGNVPSLEILNNLANMVSVDLPISAISWEDETKVAVANWATQQHLEASDNVIPDEDRLAKPGVLG